MEPQKRTTQNGIIIRKDYSAGNFIQTHKSTLTNNKLTDPGYRLLSLLMDTPESVKISLRYYQDMLGWSNDKISNASKNLVENGFLTITQYPKGIDKGFTYTFMVSEFGNLKPSTDDNGNVVKIKGRITKKKSVVAEGHDEVVETTSSDKLKTDEDYEKELLTEFRRIYKEDIAKIFPYEQIKYKKAYIEYKDWLKLELFTNYNVDYNCRQKWCMLIIKHPVITNYDEETAYAERTND